MVFIVIAVICVLILAVIRLRIIYSATYIHVIHFRTKLLKLANNDPYWYGIYATLPPLKKHIFLSVFKSMKSFMDEEAQERYIIARLPQHAVKRSTRKTEPLKYEL